MTESAKLRIPLIAAAQAQKHVTHNEGMTLLDTLVQLSVIDKDLTAPPAEPEEGDSYIVAATATGAWTGWEDRVARLIDGAWRSYLPGAGGGVGWLAFVQDEATLYVFDGAAWRPLVREMLTAGRDYFVDASSGDDNDDGLTSGTAFATIQKAIDSAAALDLGIHDVTINLADGTYTEDVVLKRCVGAGKVVIAGNNADPTAVVVSGTSRCFYGLDSVTTYEIDDLQIASSGFGIVGEGNTTIKFHRLDFAACTTHIHCTSGGIVANDNEDYSISGGGSTHILANKPGAAFASNCTVTLTGTPNFSNAFVEARIGGTLTVAANSYSGSATGKRYHAQTNGVIVTNGGGATYLPGDVAGTTATGGQYT